jgi:hypothetical protein
MRNEVNETIKFGRLQYWYYWWEGFIKYTVEMALGGMIYIPIFLMIGSRIQVILRVFPQRFERLWC